LGLAKIRDGELEDGRREIEIAASLDSGSSLIRSYLGKAYYEEKREDLDGREYEIAKELDPNDPTPWFYDAIRKQTINQPVAALHDLQKAVELNDNRAVYRSKLMLDSDLAARSASLARVYSDLGFQQRALAEGWNSVNTDPTNYSAHRFLADSYSVLPRHEIARVSELLQSQLLQSTNITPIQPQLAESNLQLISSGGAASSSFSEFNPLFNRNQVALLASGLIGEDSTDGLEGVVSGIYNKASFSVGYSTFQTDGYRDNNDQDDDIANAYLQYELSHRTSIQAEYRYRDSDRGDIQLRFFEDDYKPNVDESLETNTARIGFLHKFSPRSNLIGNFTYQDLEETETDNPAPIVSIDAKSDQDALGAELSFLFRTDKINIVSGAGYFDIDGDDKITFKIEDIVIPMPPPIPPTVIPGSTTITKAKRDATHANAYLYSHINLLDNVTITLGASGDSYDPDSSRAEDGDQFNPKFGLTWHPLPDTTIRAAAFRVLKRTLVTDQTLEPTQVAGFNQFFDDLNTTDAWRYGGAVDQKFSSSIYGGVEYSERDMDVPYFDIDVDNTRTVDWEEKFFRGYLFWTPHKWWSVTAEYLYEDFSRDEDFADGFKELTTHSLPLGVNFFHPSGLSVALKGTYIDQDGKYERVTDVRTFEKGDDDFWVADAAISYRMPKRYGFLTIGVTNLFDEEFKYFDTDSDNPRIMPDRFFFGKLTVAIP
jgi:opacity protein-like surface antigen